MFGRHSILGLLASVAMATAGCSNDTSDDEEPSFDYGRDEMKGAIEGTWEGTSKPDATSGVGSPVTLTLAYSTADAHALCNNRMLSNDGALRGPVAPRCASISSMNVAGTLTSQLSPTAAPQAIPVRGSFAVMSLRFDGHGDLHAEIAGGQLSATLSNEVLEGNVVGADGAPSLRFELRRKR